MIASPLCRNRQKSKSRHRTVLIRIQIIELAEEELRPSNSHYFLLAFALKLQWRQLLLEISQTSQPASQFNQPAATATKFINFPYRRVFFFLSGFRLLKECRIDYYLWKIDFVVVCKYVLHDGIKYPCRLLGQERRQSTTANNRAIYLGDWCIWSINPLKLYRILSTYLVSHWMAVYFLL